MLGSDSRVRAVISARDFAAACRTGGSCEPTAVPDCRTGRVMEAESHRLQEDSDQLLACVSR